MDRIVKVGNEYRIQYKSRFFGWLYYQSIMECPISCDTFEEAEEVLQEIKAKDKIEVIKEYE